MDVNVSYQNYDYISILRNVLKCLGFDNVDKENEDQLLNKLGLAIDKYGADYVISQFLR